MQNVHFLITFSKKRIRFLCYIDYFFLNDFNEFVRMECKIISVIQGQSWRRILNDWVTGN